MRSLERNRMLFAATDGYSGRVQSHNEEAAIASLTDSSGGTAAATVSATPGVYVLPIQIDLVDITGNVDVLSNIVIGHKFKILAVDWNQLAPVTTGSKAADLNIEIGSTNLTGGVVSLTSAACTPLGKRIAGSAVTANNTGAAGDNISVEASGVTAFAEGKGVLLITIQNMDTADQAATYTGKINSILTVLRNNKQILS